MIVQLSQSTLNSTTLFSRFHPFPTSGDSNQIKLELLAEFTRKYDFKKHVKAYVAVLMDFEDSPTMGKINATVNTLTLNLLQQVSISKNIAPPATILTKNVTMQPKNLSIANGAKITLKCSDPSKTDIRTRKTKAGKKGAVVARLLIPGEPFTFRAVFRECDKPKEVKSFETNAIDLF